MFIEEELKSLIEERFGNVKSFSSKINLPYTTVRSILQRGILNSNVENVIAMSEGLGFKPEDLIKFKRKDIMIVDEEQSLIDNTTDIMNELTLPRQKKVYNYAERQLEEQRNTKIVSIVGQTAAGEAIAYGDSIVEEREVSYVPKGAECALAVKGHSMEPDFKNGSVVFYKKQSQVEYGEIAVVEIEGNGVTLKKVKYDYDNEKIILQSLNKEYEDMIFDNHQIRVLGKVVK